MPIIASAASGTNFAPAPSGPQHAVCSAVFDLGEEWSDTYQKLSQKVCVFWELAEKMEDGRPFMLSKRYTLSLGDKANLRRDLEAWRGKPFTDAELKGFDLDCLIGHNVMLNVMHVTKDGKTRAQVAGVMPAMKGMPKLIVTALDVPKWAHEQKVKNAQIAASHRAEATKTPDEDEALAGQPIKPATSAADDLPF